MTSSTADQPPNGGSTPKTNTERRPSRTPQSRKRRTQAPTPNASHPLPSIKQPHARPARTPFRFFSLPPELRLMVYKQSLALPSPIDISAWSSAADPTHSHANHHNLAALLATCRQAYAEAMPILYGLNTFRLSGAANALGFLTNIGAAQLARLRSLSLEFPLRVATPKIAVCADDAYEKLADASSIEFLRFKVGFYEYSLFKSCEGPAGAWHPVTRLKGRLKEVEIAPVENSYGMTPDAFEGMALREEKFEELSSHLGGLLTGG